MQRPQATRRGDRGWRDPRAAEDRPGAAIAAILGGVEDRRRLLSSLRHLLPLPAENHIRSQGSLAELIEVVAARGPRPLIVLIGAGTPDLNVARLVQLRRRLPAAVLIAAVHVTADSALRAFELRRQGLDDVCPVDGTGCFSPEALGRLVDRALAVRVTARALQAAEPYVPAVLRGCVEELWIRCARPVTPAEAAKLYHRHPSTLTRHLRAAGLPTVQRLIGWGRLLHAANLLQHGVPSVTAVSEALGFPSEGALRNQLRRYGNMTPTDVRQRGMAVLVAQFAERCRRGDWNLCSLGGA